MSLTPLSSPVLGASVLGMTLTALVMALTPGPNMIYLVSRSISQGAPRGSSPWPAPASASSSTC